MLFRNVLVPFDGSEHAEGALHAAFSMVGDDSRAHVHVVEIVSLSALPNPAFSSASMEDPFSVMSEINYDEILGAIIERTRANLAEVADRAKDGAACQITTAAQVAASPVDGIAEYVAANGIDLVVMGRRGLGALRGMLGSVSYGVLRSVDVPVLTVK